MLPRHQPQVKTTPPPQPGTGKNRAGAPTSQPKMPNHALVSDGVARWHEEAATRQAVTRSSRAWPTPPAGSTTYGVNTKGGLRGGDEGGPPPRQVRLSGAPILPAL